MSEELTEEQKEAEKIQLEAFVKAKKIYGDNAIVGRNFNYAKSFHVGLTGLMGIWVKRGVGLSFDEAFSSIIDFPDNDQAVHNRHIQNRVVQMNKVHKKNLVFASKDERPTMEEVTPFKSAMKAERVIAITPQGQEVILKDRKGESN